MRSIRRASYNLRHDSTSNALQTPRPHLFETEGGAAFFLEYVRDHMGLSFMLDTTNQRTTKALAICPGLRCFTYDPLCKIEVRT